MLTGLFGRKNGKKIVKMAETPSLAPADTRETSSQAPHRSGASVAGVPMATFAQQAGLSLNEVWQKIQQGELPARFMNNEVSVFPDFNAAVPANPVSIAAPITTRHHEAEPAAASADADPAFLGTSEGLSPLKDPFIDNFYAATRSAGELPPVSITYETQETTRTLIKKDIHHEGVGGYNDMALLLDHLSLAKEENKEILRLTRDSIGTITAMSESIVSLKDELLQAKETQISVMQRDLEGRDEKIAKLKQELEDLQMLTETLMKAQGPEGT